MGECIVYGEMDEASGETQVKAQIFPNLDAIREKLKNVNLNINAEEIKNLFQEVIKSVNRKIPLYKHIRYISIRDSEFEKTTSRKIKRHSQQLPAQVKNDPV